jgi:hypothetical protein
VAILVNLKPFFKRHYEKAKKYLQFLIGLVILLSIFLLLWRLPLWQVSQYQLNNTMEQATLENQFRTTLAQIFGGAAIGISLYYTWRRVNIAENELKVSQEGQITERFTRAVDQLGNEKIEIRVGGIYALERIANESNKDYWQIMEILTAYVRINAQYLHSNGKLEFLKKQYHVKRNLQNILEDEKNNQIKPDIKAILTFIRENKYSFTYNNNLDLNRAYLPYANLRKANLEYAMLQGAFLANANLNKAHLKTAYLFGAILPYAELTEANLEGSFLSGADMEEANFEGANLNKADLEDTNLKGAINLTPDQLSNVKTLYCAKLDEELGKQLKEKYPEKYDGLISKPKV